MTIKIQTRAEKALGRLGRSEALRVVNFLRTRLTLLNDPAELGQPLKGQLAGC